MKLTIAIPTFNRNATLKETLRHLLPQLTTECCLLILDNHSDVPVSETLRDLLTPFLHLPISIIRHRGNIGADANGLRCFELCETEWLWVLGDDDIVEPDAVLTILNAVAKAPSALYISFLGREWKKEGSRSDIRQHESITKGVSHFITDLDTTGTIHFMSCSIWKTRVFLDKIRFGYDYAYSMSWPLILLLSSLGDDGEAFFTTEVIIKQITIAPLASRWSYVRWLLGCTTVLELSLSERDQTVFARKMLSRYTPEAVTAYVLADRTLSSPKQRRLYYDLVVGRMTPYKLHFCSRIRFSIYRLLFIHPKLGWTIVKTAIKLSKMMGRSGIDIADLSRATVDK
jgi:glycosyltransferase involved in cell wall biosynthesis